MTLSSCSQNLRFVQAVKWSASFVFFDLFLVSIWTGSLCQWQLQYLVIILFVWQLFLSWNIDVRFSFAVTHYMLTIWWRLPTANVVQVWTPTRILLWVEFVASLGALGRTRSLQPLCVFLDVPGKLAKSIGENNLRSLLLIEERTTMVREME